MNLQTMTIDRISALKEELKALKRERKLAAFAIKISREWLSVKNGTPDRQHPKGNSMVRPRGAVLVGRQQKTMVYLQRDVDVA